MENMVYTLRLNDRRLLPQQLTKMIPKSEVGVLSSDSNNVVQLIENGYRVCTDSHKH